MSAASCVTQLDHQTCRGSSIGRACGSYHYDIPNLKVAGSSPAFGYSYTFSCHFFFALCRSVEKGVGRRLEFCKNILGGGKGLGGQGRLEI
jgi:hypothetical protein